MRQIHSIYLSASLHPVKLGFTRVPFGDVERLESRIEANPIIHHGTDQSKFGKGLKQLSQWVIIDGLLRTGINRSD